MIADGAPALRQPRSVIVIKRGVGFKPVLESGGTGTFQMEKLKELLNDNNNNNNNETNSNHSKTKQHRAKPPKNQKRPKPHKQRM